MSQESDLAAAVEHFSQSVGRPVSAETVELAAAVVNAAERGNFPEPGSALRDSMHTIVACCELAQRLIDEPVEVVAVSLHALVCQVEVKAFHATNDANAPKPKRKTKLPKWHRR
jgi:hypothetical protein